MEFVVAGNSRSRAWCESLLPSLINQLGLTNSCKVVFVRIKRGMDVAGHTNVIPGLNSYLIEIKQTRNLNEMGKTLAHEMVHVRQMARGILKSVSRGVRIWAGKRYSKNTPYLDQPWEQDAFARTEILYRRAIEVK